MAIPLPSPLVFPLPHLDFTAPHAALPRLSSISAHFALPDLGYDDSTNERLLGSLRAPETYDLRWHSGWGADGQYRKAGDDDSVDQGCKTRRVSVPLSWHEVEARDAPNAGFQPLQSWDNLDIDFRGKQSSLLNEDGRQLFQALQSSRGPALDIPSLTRTDRPIFLDALGLLQQTMQKDGETSKTSPQWSESRGRFVRRQEGRSRGVGTVPTASDEQMLNIASSLRRLEIIIDEQSLQPQSSTHHALLYNLSIYLLHVKHRLSSFFSHESLSRGSTDPPSLSSELRDVQSLLSVLCEMMGWPLNEVRPIGLPKAASTILSELYTRLVKHHSDLRAGKLFSGTLAIAWLLSQSAEPIMVLIRQWIGLLDSDSGADSAAQPWGDIGISRRPSRSGAEAWEYDFISRDMPSFIPKEARHIIFEAGRSLRLLNGATAGRHPLCRGEWQLDVSWPWDQPELRHLRRVQEEVELWRRNITEEERARSIASSISLGRLKGWRKVRQGLPPEFLRAVQKLRSSSPSPSMPLNSEDEQTGGALDLAAALLEQLPASRIPSDGSTGSWTAKPLEELEAVLESYCNPPRVLLAADGPTVQEHINFHFLAPLLAHSNLVSASLVSLYLDDLRFLEHLDLLRAFWLGGDVDFCERVSAALFGREEAGAGEAIGQGRRARTRARMGLGGGEGEGTAISKEWGIGLGLGLSERARWPPGGAELAYALRTTLVDVDTRGRPAGPVWEDVENRVSFAVMPLPEETSDGKRAKWMKPQAIEALDFLYLAYSPPPSVSILLPDALLKKYQEVHNFLLRLGRVNTVARSSFVDLLHPSNISSEPIKVGVDSGLNRPPSRTGVVEAESQSVPADANEVEPGIHQLALLLRFRMSGFVGTLHRYILDVAIGANWDVMRRRLERLKRRVPGKDDSRPPTLLRSQEEWVDEISAGPRNREDRDDDGADTVITSVRQMQSIQSLVTYHHLTMDRILRACLLYEHPAYETAYDTLMKLFELVLDFGKAVKEVERRMVDVRDGAERIRGVATEWGKTEARFMHVLKKLSRMSLGKEDREEDRAENDDLELLLEGEKGCDDGAEDQDPRRGPADLQDLVLRLSLGTSVGPPIVRADDDDDDDDDED